MDISGFAPKIETHFFAVSTDVVFVASKDYVECTSI